MAKYKNKVSGIDAVKISELVPLTDTNWATLPDWVKTQYSKGNVLFGSSYIVLNGEGVASVQDWLILDASGKLSSIPNSDFVSSYEADNGAI